MSRFKICRRLDAALEKARFRKLDIKAIYLTKEDHDALDRAESSRWKRKVSALSYRDIDIRRGEQSRLYSKHGVAVAVPKDISKRTQPTPAKTG